MSSVTNTSPIHHGAWTFEPWILHKDIESRTRDIAAFLGKKYAGQNIRLITVLRGAQPFADMLYAALQGLPDGPASIQRDALRVKSYAGTSSTGKLEWLQDLATPTRADVHDIIVEDICDSGRTLSVTEEALRKRGPASLITVVMLDRPEARAAGIAYTPAIVAFHITKPEVWAIGFGLDLDEDYRDRPHVYGKVVDGQRPPAYTVPPLSASEA